MNEGVKAHANRTSPLEPATTEAGSLLRLAFSQTLVIVPWGGRAPRIPSGKKTITRMRMDATPRAIPGLAPLRDRPTGLESPFTGSPPPSRPSPPLAGLETRIDPSVCVIGFQRGFRRLSEGMHTEPVSGRILPHRKSSVEMSSCLLTSNQADSPGLMDARFRGLRGVPGQAERWQAAASDVQVLGTVVVGVRSHIDLCYTVFYLPCLGSATASSGRRGAVRLVDPQRGVRRSHGELGNGGENPAANRERRIRAGTRERNLAA